MNILRSARSRHADAWPSLPPGRRIYAIGDIHGSATLLNRLIDRILADCIGRGEQHETLVILGDFIDRGAESAAIMQSLFAQRSSDNVVVLLGNHESALMSAYRGNRQAMAFWPKFGGAATLASFGANTAAVDRIDIEPAMILLRRSVPSGLIDWMAALPTSYRAGDYLFVHAGIRPRVALHRQKATDLFWIREPFLTSEHDHGVVVVHDHSPVPQVEFRTNKICVDTGAYDSGVLSAIGLEAGRRWVIEPDSQSSGVEVVDRPHPGHRGERDGAFDVRRATMLILLLPHNRLPQNS